MNKRITHIALMMLCQCAFYLTTTASVVVDKKVEQIKLEIQRIDLIDGKEDQLVFLKSDLQSEYATQTYLVSSAGIVEKILENIGPLINLKDRFLVTTSSSIISVPVISLGIRSGVN